MAGDWIKWVKGLTRKPEVLAISEALGMDRRAVASRCMEIWEWWDENSLDGNAASVTVEFLDDLVGYDGFASSMISVKWLVLCGDKMTVPNFGRHHGKTAKRRALGQNRVQTHRNSAGVTKASPEKRREEKRRGDNKKNKGGRPSRMQLFLKALPETHHTDAVRAVLADWIVHRSQIRKPLTPLTITRQAKLISEWTPADTIETLERSIRNGWTGIDWKNKSSQGRSSSTTHRDAKSAREFSESPELPPTLPPSAPAH